MLALQFGLVSGVDWGQRIIAGFLLGVALLTFYTLALGAGIEHQKTMTELQTAQRFLIRQRRSSETVVESENFRLLNQAQSLLTPKLDAIHRLLEEKGAISASILELKSLISNTVRPLSQELSTYAQKLSNRPDPLKVSAIPIRILSPRVELKNSVKLLMIILFTLPSQFIITAMIDGSATAFMALPSFLLGFIILYLLRLLIPINLVLSRGLAIMALAGIGVLTGLPSYFYLVATSSNESAVFLFSMIVFAPACGVTGFAVAGALDRDRLAAESKLIQENAAIDFESSVFDQRVWLARRRWSFVIYGTVQAALTAALTRLSTKTQITSVELALQDLERAQNSLRSTPTSDVDLSVAMLELADTWRGICEVTTYFHDSALTGLEQSANARVCFNEIAKEVVSNAVRHGQAKQVTIETRISGKGILSLKASNNGALLPENFEQGVGSQMLDELCIDWSLRNNRLRGTVVFEATLPITASQAIRQG